MMLLKRLVACVVTFVAVFAGGAAAFAANEPMGQPHPWQMNLQEIGRASCRERV